MRRRQPLPRTWLMTDPRMGDSLFAAIRRLPRGSGIVFRHAALPPAQRRALFEQVSRLARRHGHVVLRAGPDRLGRREDGVHRGPRPARGLWTMPAHDARQIRQRAMMGVDALFVSPVFATRSHPGARTLGALRFAMLIRGVRCPVIALGGVNRRHASRLARLGAYGWAGIDAWL